MNNLARPPRSWRPDDFGASPLRTRLHDSAYLDDDLLDGHRGLAGLREKTLSVREAVTDRLAREAAQLLARLGGTEPDVDDFAWRP